MNVRHDVSLMQKRVVLYLDSFVKHKIKYKSLKVLRRQIPLFQKRKESVVVEMLFLT